MVESLQRVWHCEGDQPVGAWMFEKEFCTIQQARREVLEPCDFDDRVTLMKDILSWRASSARRNTLIFENPSVPTNGK